MNTYYLQSKYVKVFPCTYRGTYIVSNDETAETKTFDPEARLTTESNYTNIPGFHYPLNSYVVSFEDDLLKCVIDGYYFELLLKNDNDESLFAVNTEGQLICTATSTPATKIRFYIGLKQIQLTPENTLEIERDTEVLSNLNNSGNTVLDTLDLTLGNNKSYFYGIRIMYSASGEASSWPTNTDNITYKYLENIFSVSGGSAVVNPARLLPEIYHGELDGSAVVPGKLTVDGSIACAGTINGTTINRATIDGTNINGATVDGTNINGATINNGSIDTNNGSITTGSGKINNATINGTNINGATIGGTNINGAIISGGTIDTNNKNITTGSGTIKGAMIEGTTISADNCIIGEASSNTNYDYTQNGDLLTVYGNTTVKGELSVDGGITATIIGISESAKDYVDGAGTISGKFDEVDSALTNLSTQISTIQQDIASLDITLTEGIKDLQDACGKLLINGTYYQGRTTDTTSDTGKKGYITFII